MVHLHDQVGHEPLLVMKSVVSHAMLHMLNDFLAGNSDKVTHISCVICFKWTPKDITVAWGSREIFHLLMHTLNGVFKIVGEWHLEIRVFCQ